MTGGRCAVNFRPRCPSGELKSKLRAAGSARTISPKPTRTWESKKFHFFVDTLWTLEYLASPLLEGTSGSDCLVQIFDNRIACDGPIKAILGSSPI